MDAVHPDQPAAKATRADRQASSPNPHRQAQPWRDGNVNSGYPRRRDNEPAAGGSRYYSNDNYQLGLENYGEPHPTAAAGGYYQPDPRAGYEPNRAASHAGYRQAEPAPRVRLTNVCDRLGPLGPATGIDPRQCLNTLEASKILNEEDMAGHQCLGPRITSQPFPKGFMLPKDTPKYDSTTKPENWLVVYVTRVGITGGNRRVAVRYALLMMKDVTRTWMNSLPTGGNQLLAGLRVRLHHQIHQHVQAPWPPTTSSWLCSTQG